MDRPPRLSFAQWYALLCFASGDVRPDAVTLATAEALARKKLVRLEVERLSVRPDDGAFTSWRCIQVTWRGHHAIRLALPSHRPAAIGGAS